MLGVRAAMVARESRDLTAASITETTRPLPLTAAMSNSASAHCSTPRSRRVSALAAAAAADASAACSSRCAPTSMDASPSSSCTSTALSASSVASLESRGAASVESAASIPNPSPSKSPLLAAADDVAAVCGDTLASIFLTLAACRISSRSSVEHSPERNIASSASVRNGSASTSSWSTAQRDRRDAERSADMVARLERRPLGESRVDRGARKQARRAQTASVAERPQCASSRAQRERACCGARGDGVERGRAWSARALAVLVSSTRFSSPPAWRLALRVSKGPRFAFRGPFRAFLFRVSRFVCCFVSKKSWFPLPRTVSRVFRHLSSQRDFIPRATGRRSTTALIVVSARRHAPLTYGETIAAFK